MTRRMQRICHILLYNDIACLVDTLIAQ
jgi:hypothetical protein